MASWGNNCVIVDQWYALQTGGAPAMYVNGPAAHANYVGWVGAPANTLNLLATFTTGNYPWLHVPQI